MGFTFLRKWSEFTACGFISDNGVTCFSVFVFVIFGNKRTEEPSKATGNTCSSSQ